MSIKELFEKIFGSKLFTAKNGVFYFLLLLIFIFIIALDLSTIGS
jgi:hypothetical protein